jgi:hypothetical protein
MHGAQPNQAAGGLGEALKRAPSQTDLLRLQRGLAGAGTPLAGRAAQDRLSIMLRRSPDFDAVAAALRCAPLSASCTLL